MIQFTRFQHNPIVVPHKEELWEREGTFNPSVLEENNTYHLLFRAQSARQIYKNNSMSISTIGYASGSDGEKFGKHRRFIIPEQAWEIFGCEDPRVTKLDKTFFIFYTALSTFPFVSQGIKVGVALTRDFQTVSEKHLVTNFNAKAMALFPEKIQGKIAAVLTVNTDIPPARISVAYFDSPEQIWSDQYWGKWYENLDEHVVPLLRTLEDHVETGAVPVRVENGWLLIYSYIRNYFKPTREFGIEAVLLDKNNPQKVLGRTLEPLLIPETEYEISGNVPKVVFPTSAIIKEDKLFVYYGAADTTCCLADINLDELLREIYKPEYVALKTTSQNFGEARLERFFQNPILSPILEHPWESRATFNPGVFYEDNTIHLLYRAMSQDNTSVLGYATSADGYHITERYAIPVYVPREGFERKTKMSGNSGCEDPRITKIGDTLYVCYTAFDGTEPPRVALTSISVEDFLHKRWNWKESRLISPPGIDDKDACVLSELIDKKYIVFHRIGDSIWIDKLDSLLLPEGKYIGGEILMNPRQNMWDNGKIGIAAPPIKTEKGWLLLYHGSEQPGNIYKVGAALLDVSEITKVLARSSIPLLEPALEYEIIGEVPNVVFPCGAIIKDGVLFVYYGGGDKVVGVATCSLETLVARLLEQSRV